MKNIICRTLILSAVALAAAAPAAIAQQAQDPNAPPTAPKAGLVITPLGTFSVKDDGSLQSFDFSQGIVSTPDGAFTVQPDGSLQPIDPNPSDNIAPQTGTPYIVPNNASKTTLPPGAAKPPFDKAQILQTFAQQIQLQQQQKENALRDALACTDQEWSLLLPKIKNIQLLQSAIIPGSPVRVPKIADNAPSSLSALGNLIQKFHDISNNKDATPDQVAQSLTAVRNARNTIKSQLAQARRELTDLVTPQQEATLFDRGILAD